MASRKQKKKVSTLFTCNPTNYIIKKKIRRVDFNSSHPDALKCQDPYYDVDTRHLKNAMDLSQELDKPKYKNKPVKSWNLGHRKYLPCEDDDYVRLVNDNFCCEPAKHRKSNPLSKDPNYDRKLEERKQAYLDLFKDKGGVTDSSMRRNTVPLTEKLFKELKLPHAPNSIPIIHNGRSGLIPKSHLIQYKDYYLSQGTLIDLSSINRESKQIVTFLARSTAPGAAPDDPQTIRGKRNKKIKPPRGKALNPKVRNKYTGKAAQQAFNNAGKLHKELLTNNAKMAEYGSSQNAVIAGIKKQYSKKKKPTSKIKGKKPSPKGKAKVRGRSKGREKK